MYLTLDYSMIIQDGFQHVYEVYFDGLMLPLKYHDTGTEQNNVLCMHLDDKFQCHIQCTPR